VQLAREQGQVLVDEGAVGVHRVAGEEGRSCARALEPRSERDDGSTTRHWEEERGRAGLTASRKVLRHVVGYELVHLLHRVLAVEACLRQARLRRKRASSSCDFEESTQAQHRTGTYLAVLLDAPAPSSS